MGSYHDDCDPAFCQAKRIEEMVRLKDRIVELEVIATDATEFAAHLRPTYHVTYSGGAGCAGSLVTESFDEAVRAIVAAARSGHMVKASLVEK